MTSRLLLLLSTLVLLSCGGRGYEPLTRPGPTNRTMPIEGTWGFPPAGVEGAGATWTPGPLEAPPTLDPQLGFGQPWTNTPALGLTIRGLPEIALRSMRAHLVDPDSGELLATLRPETFEGHRYEWGRATERPVDLAWSLAGQQIVATTHTGLRIDPNQPLDLGPVELGERLDAWVFDLTHPDPNAELAFNLKAVDADGKMVGTGLPAEPGVFVVLSPPPVARLELRVGSTTGGGWPRVLELPPGRHTLDLSKR